MHTEQNNLSWLHTPASGNVNPPVQTRVQELPFGELSWEDFEKLCYRLARSEADIEHCQLYGERGDEQQGIDIFARTINSKKYAVYQCKREDNFGPAKIAYAVEEFIKGKWLTESEAFILCTKESLRSKVRSDEVEKQASVLRMHSVSLRVWDSEELSSKLKALPELVDDFFGREWVRAFCGEDAARQLKDRLDAAQLKEFRSQLLSFYQRVFNIHDRGIPIPSALPLSQRYVVPDIEDQVISHTISSTISSAPTSERVNNTSALWSKEEKNERTLQSERQVRHYIQRIPVQNWLTRGKHNLLFGDPGSGKSTLLRFLALDLLSNNPTLNIISEQWGNYLPVWIPFALWTKVIIEGSPAERSVKGLLEQWLRSWDADVLISLIQDALKDKRLLLLVDGLDEYSSEDSAKIALNHLESFLSENGSVVIATTRPYGFERLGLKLEGWQQARIADFSAKQQEALAKIWFEANSAKINPELEKELREYDVQRQVNTFLSELARSKELRELAKNPLLLCLLIYFQIANIRLPIRRFEAYGVLTDHLISTHPQVRRLAADTPQHQQLSDSDIKKALAYFAHTLQSKYLEGLLEEEKSLQVLIEFLKDDDQGFGMDQAQAMQIARHIFNQAESNLGIIVRRSQNEIGFYHRTIQEYLASFNISRLPLEKQLEIVEQNCTNPVWREVILGLFQITTKPNEIKSLVEEIRGKTITHSERKIIESLLSEVAFGDFNCPTNLARDLAKQAFVEIELGTWMPHREKILKYALDGLRSLALAGLVKEKIRVWFPNRVGFKLPYVFEAMSKWSLAQDLLHSLFKGLNAEDYRVKTAASSTLARIANHDTTIGDRLATLAKQTDDPYVSAAAIEAMILGWPDHEQLPATIERFMLSPMPILQLVRIKGKVALGLQEDKHLQKLLRLAHWESGLYLFDGDIPLTIMKGWPKSEKVKKICLESVRVGSHGVHSHNIERDIALRILLEGFPMDEEVVEYCVSVIKSDKRFIALDSIAAFRWLAKNFKDHPKLVQAIDEWLQTTERWDVEASLAALVGRTDISKKRLIEDLNKSFPHWPAGALLEGWGMQVQDVADALLDAVNGPASHASNFGQFMPQIITDKKGCRERLLSLLQDPDCHRYDFVMDGFIELGNTEDDTEVVDVALSALKNIKNDYTQGLKQRLITYYGFDPRVRALAIEAIDNRDDVYIAVAYAFGEDQEVRKKILNIVNPLPVTLRQVIATYLSEAEIDEIFDMSILDLYDHEIDSQVKVQASIGFHTRLKASGKDHSSALERLSKTIACYGHDYIERRLAAFCGLTILNRLDLMINAQERIGGAEKVAIQSIGGLNLNVPHVRFILKNWDKLEDLFKEEFWERLFRYSHDSNEIWNQLGQLADEYDAPKIEVLNYLSHNNPKIAPSNLLQFLSRTMPGSNLLFEYCLNTVGLNRVNVQANNIHLTYVDKVIAANLIGDHYAGKSEILQKIDLKQDKWLSDEIVMVLSEGWPHSDELEQILAELVKSRRHFWESTIIRYYCLKSGPRTMYKQLLKLLKRMEYRNRTAENEAVLRPLIRRLRKDDKLVNILLRHLNKYPRATEKVSIPKLIYMAEGESMELRDWMQNELAYQLSGNGVESGFDITTGSFISVPHALYEILDKQSMRPLFS